MRLFVEPAEILDMDKTASAPTVSMPENMGKWPQVIENELRKLYPYLGMYLIHIDMVSVDPDSRTAYGKIYVSTDNSRPDDGNNGSLPTTAVLKSMAAKKSVMVPFIIKDGDLLPMDLMVADGKTVPVTEARISKALFRPDLHDSLAEKKDSMTSSMFAHYGQDPTTMPGSSSYMSYKIGEFTDLAAATGYVEHVQPWLEEIKTAGANFRQVVLSNTPVVESLKKLVQIKGSRVDTDDVEKVARHVHPTTFLMRKEGDAYVVKTASSYAYSPVEVRFTRPQAIKALGIDLVKKADLGGVVMNTSVRLKELEKKAARNPEPVKTFGVYKVSTELGDLTGMVFPKVVSPFDGKRLPLQIFVTPTVYVTAPQIKGESTDKPPVYESKVPHGYGIFIVHDGDDVVALEPMDVLSTMKVGDVISYRAKSVTGMVFEVVRAVEVKKPIYSAGVLYLPVNADWVPMSMQVAGKDLDTSTIDSDTVTITRVGSGLFRFSGTPVARLPEKELRWGDALFTLGLVGCTMGTARSYLDKAIEKGKVEVHGARTIELMEPKLNQVMEKLGELRQSADDIRTDLFKEALFIPDPESVDVLLGLNFINEDNLKEFVQRIPRLEEVLSTLGNLLFAVRLGIGDERIPESALKKAVEGLDVVISKLNRLKYTWTDRHAPNR